jgi:hypothetical protein
LEVETNFVPQGLAVAVVVAVNRREMPKSAGKEKNQTMESWEKE